MLSMKGGTLGTLDSLATQAAADCDSNRDSNGQPDREVSGGDPECSAEGRTKCDA
jgi:hypothetical protein